MVRRLKVLGFASSQIRCGLTHSGNWGQNYDFSPFIPMNPGRPPIWNPFRDHTAGSWTELAVVAKRGRLTIPTAVRKCINWLSPLPREGLLATIEPAGRIELLPWLDAGKAVIETRIEQLNAMKEPSRGEFAIAL